MTKPENPAELEYKKARALMNAQELGYPVLYQGSKYYIQEFQRFEDSEGPGFKTALYLKGIKELIPSSEIEIKEQPK